jgi:hypothetical protein
MSLTTRVLIGLVAGFLLGLTIAGSTSPAVTTLLAVMAPVGTIFINLNPDDGDPAGRVDADRERRIARLVWRARGAPACVRRSLPSRCSRSRQSRPS